MKRIPMDDFSDDLPEESPAAGKRRKYTLEEIDTLTLDELLEARQNVTASMNAALAQLGNAKAGAAMDQYADPVWYRRCQAAVRFMNQVLARIKTRKARLNEERHAVSEEAKMRRFKALVAEEIGEDRTMELLRKAESV